MSAAAVAAVVAVVRGRAAPAGAVGRMVRPVAASWSRHMEQSSYAQDAARRTDPTSAASNATPSSAPRAVPAVPQVVPLAGAMTGLSKDVLRNIRRAALGGRAKDFLTEVAVRSFGNAGYAREDGDPDPGTSCPFDLAEWTTVLGWHKPDVLKIREQVCALGILRFERDPAAPGRGLLRWNLDFTTWRALDDDYRRARYARPGPHPGRPRKQASVSHLNNTEPTQQASVSHLNTTGKDKQASVSRLNNENNSNDLRKEFKRLTPGGAQAAIDAGAAGPKEKEEEKEIQTSPNGDARSAPRRRTDAPRAHATPAKAEPARRPSEAERERHNEEAAWVRVLVEGLTEAWGAPLPMPKAYRQLGHTFYARPVTKDAAHGGRPEIDDLLACWCATLLDPFYATAPPTPAQFERGYSAWVKGRTGYTRAMEAKAKRLAWVDDERDKGRQARGEGNGSTFGAIARL